MKIKREVKIGIVVLIGLALLYYGLYFLKGINILGDQKTYYAFYKRVDGLVQENPVTVNGLKIGQVSDVYFTDNKTGKIGVKFYISEDMHIPVNSTARLYSSDLMGSKAIEIQLGDSKKYVSNGDTLKTERERSLTEQVSIQMLPVKRKAENLMLSVDSLLAVIKYVFNEESRYNIAKSLENIKHTFQNLEHTTSTIDTLMSYQRSRLAGIIANVESITYNLRKNNQQLSNILANVSSITDSVANSEIASTISNTNESVAHLANILEKINNKEGSLGLLVNDDSLYNNLDASAKELELLLEDLRANPDRYIHFSVFGRKSKKK